MKRMILALSALIMLLGQAPAVAQEHQHAAPPDIKSEAVAPLAPKSPVAKTAMSEKMAEMKRKMAEKVNAQGGAVPAHKGMMKGPASKDSSKNEERK